MNFGELLATYGIGILEMALILLLMRTKFPAKYPSKVEFPITLIGLYTIIELVTVSSSSVLQTILYPIIILLYLLVFRTGLWYVKLFWTFLAFAFLSVSILLTNILSISFFSATAAELDTLPVFVQLQLSSFAKLIQAILYFFLAKKKIKRIRVSKSVFLTLLLVPVFSIGIMLVILDYSVSLGESGIQMPLLLLASFGVLAINAFSFILYDRMSAQSEKILEQEALLQKSAFQQAQYKEVTAIYDDMKAWRHDYRNHLQALKGLLTKEDPEPLNQYLNSIEHSLSNIDRLIHSGNDLLDAILNAKISLAKNNGIDISADIDALPSLKIEDIDLCSLLGNLLDNAIESCQRITEENAKRFIVIHFAVAKGQLRLLVQNSTNGVFQKEGNRYFTVKADHRHHGVGLRQIDTVVDKYHGMVDRQYKNYIFETEIMLPVG
jgi:sensor histidine kinase YesM